MPSVEEISSVRRAIYDEGVVRTRSGRTIEAFPTGLRRATSDVLVELVAREGARVTLETGFGLGLSALSIIEGARHTTEDPRHTAMDPHHVEWADDAGRVTLERAGVLSCVRVFEEDSLLRMPALVAAGESFDLAFVDGAHWFEYALIDAVYALRLVKPAGLVIMDDTWMPGVRAAAAYLQINLRCTRELTGNDEVDQRVTVLRSPPERLERDWQDYTPFATS